MYDALLDELEDEGAPSPDEAVDLADKDDVVDDDDDIVDDASGDGEDGELKGDDLLLAGEENESWSDDPVRMYLTQMGEIPLLTRKEEIALAKEIEITRARFRRKLLECDYVIQAAVKVLRRVHTGELPFRPDRAGFGHRPAGKRPDHGPLSAQSPHAGDPAETQSTRLPDCLQQVSQGGRTPRGLAPLRPTPVARRAVGRGTRPADPADRGHDPHVGRLQPPRRRPQASDRSPQSQQERYRRTSPPDRRVPQYSASHSGNAHQLAPPGQLPEGGLHAVPASQARPVGRQPPSGRLDCQEVSQPRVELPGSRFRKATPA